MENVTGCVEEITGIKDCSVPIECELDVNATTACNDAGDGFILTLEITGNDTDYSVDLGETILTGQSGTVEIPLPNGAYSVVVIAENVPACTYVIAGTQDCSGGDCSIQASSETTCIGASESYFVNVTLNGEKHLQRY